MKRLLLALPLLTALVLTTGCVIYRAPVIVPPGGIYQHTQAPLDINFDKTAVATKSGSASVTYIQLLYPQFSASFMEDKLLDEAIKNAGLTTLSYADYEVFNVLSLYTRFTVHAYGE